MRETVCLGSLWVAPAPSLSVSDLCWVSSTLGHKKTDAALQYGMVLSQSLLLFGQACLAEAFTLKTSQNLAPPHHKLYLCGWQTGHVLVIKSVFKQSGSTFVLMLCFENIPIACESLDSYIFRLVRKS